MEEERETADAQGGTGDRQDVLRDQVRQEDVRYLAVLGAQILDHDGERASAAIQGQDDSLARDGDAAVLRDTRSRTPA
ncbi:MAG: hypothetical protein WKF81_02815 [Thermomicrobiales bacterium]